MSKYFLYFRPSEDSFKSPVSSPTTSTPSSSNITTPTTQSLIKGSSTSEEENVRQAALLDPQFLNDIETKLQVTHESVHRFN